VLWSLTLLGSFLVTLRLTGLDYDESPHHASLLQHLEDRALKQKQQQQQQHVRRSVKKTTTKRKRKRPPSLTQQLVSTAYQFLTLPSTVLSSSSSSSSSHHHKKKKKKKRHAHTNNVPQQQQRQQPHVRGQPEGSSLLLQQQRQRGLVEGNDPNNTNNNNAAAAVAAAAATLQNPMARASAATQLAPNTIPLAAAAAAKEEEMEEEEQDEEAPPTPAPTEPSLFQTHQYPVVHVIHTPLFFLSQNKTTTTTNSNNMQQQQQQQTQQQTQDEINATVPSALAWAQLELWQRVTLPSLQHQTNADFLYICWVNGPQLHPQILQRLRQILEQALPLQVIVLDITTTSTGTTTGAATPSSSSSQMSLPTAASALLDQPQQSVVGGRIPGKHVLEYAHQATFQPLLETTLQPGDALFGEFVATIQKEAQTSLAVAVPHGNSASGSSSSNFGAYSGNNNKDVSTGGYFQIWCSHLYLEWYLDNPWNRKAGKRGILLGQLGLRSNDPAHRHHKFRLIKKHHQHHHSQKLQQCDFASGLTIGTTPGLKEPVTYDVNRGLEGKWAVQLQQARKKAQSAQHTTSWTIPFLGRGSSSSSSSEQEQQTNHLLPNCMEEQPRNCLRYIDVGLNEYGVLRTRTWAAVDQLDRVDVILSDSKGDDVERAHREISPSSHNHNAANAVDGTSTSNAGTKHLIPIDVRWRSIQDHTFAILKGRFGVDPKALSTNLKPLLKQYEAPIVQQQYEIQSKMCQSRSIMTSVANRLVRRLKLPDSEPDPVENLESLGGVETSMTDSVLASSFVPKECHVPCLHAVEIRFQEIQQELDLQRQAEEERLQNALTEKAAADEAQRARDRAQALAAASFTKYARQHNNGGDEGGMTDEVRLHPYQGLPESKPNRTAAVLRKWQNKRQKNVVHVVHTRFMQHQAKLLNLGKARIDLFQTFTVPSMRHQTTQDYLWIIWTDPNLDKHLLYGLMEELKDFPNAVVVGNLEIVTQDFRQSMNGLMLEDNEKLIDPKTVLWGSRLLLIDYYKKSKSRVLLETRLDADDALSHDFLETVQREAATSISQTDTTDYRVWCANRFMDWRYYEPEELPKSESREYLEEQLGTNEGPKIEKGYLSPEKDLKGCVTVGLTMGFQTKADLQQLPTKEHHKIRQSLPSCDESAKHCIQGLVPPENQFFGLRARTPTSTSMVNVVVDDVMDAGGATLTQFDLWNTVQRDFFIAPTTVWDLRNRFQAALPDILLDAIAGLCKAGHSCRHSSKNTLMDLLKKAVAEVTASEQANQEKKDGTIDGGVAKEGIAASRTSEQEAINKQFAALASEMKSKEEHTIVRDLNDKLEKLSSMMSVSSSMDNHNITQRNLVASELDTSKIQDDTVDGLVEPKNPVKSSLGRPKTASELSLPRVYVPQANPDIIRKEHEGKNRVEDMTSVEALLLEGGDAIND